MKLSGELERFWEIIFISARREWRGVLIYGFYEKIWTIVVSVNRSYTHVLQNTTLLPNCLICVN